MTQVEFFQVFQTEESFWLNVSDAVVAEVEKVEVSEPMKGFRVDGVEMIVRQSQLL